MGAEDSDKITRSSGDTLAIKLTEDEEAYRAKYLPDPKKLTDEKLVCTVCSVSLAREIHQGKTVQVHRALKVLVCEACFTFYGDGCFSADEDGDDKYCRWCGQGGTLFLCSTCNCAFCQKCVKQNLKASVLADLEKDDWKCYFCNPRPLFGCRTICWGALELNKIGMEKEKEKLKKQRERLEKMEARKREREEHLQKLKKLDMSSEDEQSTKKRKSRVQNSDSSSSEVMPAKKTRSSEGRGHVNGNIDRSRRKRRDSSSDEDDSDNKKTTSKLRNRNKRTKKPADSSSEDEPDVRSKSKGKLKKKPSKDTSDSSDEDTKSKRRPEKEKNDSSDDESSDEKHVKKKRMTRRKKNDSESSSDNKPKKKNLRRKKKDLSAEDKSNDDRSKKKTKVKKKNQAEDSSDNSEDNSKRDRKNLSESKKGNDDSDDESKKSRKHVNDKCVADGKAEELKLKGNDASVDNALVRKRIKLAVLWLGNAVKDISELGTLISIRATKFGKKKINLENLKTYDDVLNAVSKLKQLMSGIHSNYEHLEKGLEAQIKPWKILTGLEEPDKEKNIIEEANTTAKSEEVIKEVKPSEIFEQSTVEEVSLKSETTKENNATDDMVLQWSGLSADEDSSEEKMATKALISKAKDTLDKEDMINGETETTKNDFSKEKVIDQSKKQDNTADDVSLTPPKNSTNIDDTENSESLLNQSENGLKDDSQTLVETSEKEDENEAQDRSNISNKTDALHSGSDTDMFDASEIISSTQVNNGEDDDCSGDESKAEKRKDSPESASKRKSELKASVDACLRSPRVRVQEQSSDNEFDSFSKKLQNKWLPEDNMNLKTSLGIDSSGDSDVEPEKNKDKEKNIVLKSDSYKEKTKKENVKCSEKMIDKSKDSDDKFTSDNSESKVKDAPEEEKPDRPKRTLKVNENNKDEGGKNNKTEKLDRNNVLTSDEESEHEDIEKNEDKFAKNKRNKKDSTTKKQKNKSGDKKKTHKKDRHSSESDDTEENKNGKRHDNKKNKKDVKKQCKKETEERKNKLSSDESEDEDMANDSNSKTHQSKRNKKSTTNHKKDKKSSESDDTKKADDKVKEVKKRCSQNKKNKDEIKKQSKKEIKDKKNTLSSEDSEDENSKNDSNSKNHQSKTNMKSSINHEKEKHSSDSDDTKGDKQNKAKEDNLKGSVNKKNKVETKKQSKEETQERKNILSSDDSGDEDMKKDKSTVNKKKDRHSSESNDIEGENNDKVKEDKKKGSQNKKTKVEVKKQSKNEVQERKNTLSSDDSGNEDMKKNSNSTIHQSNINKKSTINRKKDRNSSVSDDAEEENNDKVKKGKKKGSENKKTKDEVKKQSKRETQERKNTLSSDDSGDEDIKKDSNSTINQSNRNKKDKKNCRNSSHSEDSEKDEKSNTNKKDEQSIIKEKSENKLDKSKDNDSLDESLDVDMEAKNKSIKSNTPRESSEDKEKKTDSQNKSLGKKSEEKSEVVEDCDIGDLAEDQFQDTNLSDECVQLEDDHEICEVSVEESSKAVEDKKIKEKPVKKKSERNGRQKKNLALLDSSDEEDLAANNANSPQKGNSDVEENDEAKEDSIRSASTINLSSDDSSDFEVIKKRKRKPKSSSDSEPFEVSEDEDKKTTKKRKRIKIAESSSDEASGSDEENVKVKRKRKSSVGESPGKGGRKNIKKIKGKDDLADATKEAAEEEKERRRRVEERQKLFNQVFEVKEAHVLDKLVLDFDPKEKKELLSVNKALVSKMKPHQAKGVKFMWDSCFESLSEVKKKKGSGCILAHCMGLGKTFQVISLVHTLITNNEETGIHTVMVVCPLSTVLNWYNEFDKWLQDVEGGDDIEVFHLTKCKQNPERARELRRWQHNGGVLIMGYEMFRNLSAENKKFRAKMKKDFQETLIDPGADLIVCDEGHMLKNEQTALSKAMTKVRTLRRIILTGTPMQNNLNEYHCMVQFVKPNLLGTRKEFLNRFVNPITNGQFVDSTDSDVKVMKRRAHVLHKMLEGLVQRFDYNVLTPFLPPKHEYVVSVCLSELQIKLYQHYLQHFSQQSENNKGGARLFQDWQALGRIWTHPRVLKMSSDKANWLREKKALEESDSEGSLKDFIDDGSDAETTAESSDDNSSFASDKSDSPKKSKSHSRGRVSTRSTRSNKNIALLDSSEDEKEKKEEEAAEAATANDGEWWSEFVEPNHLDDINQSGKLVLLLGILKECEMIEDKILVFSQSLFSLDLIEYFLDKIDQATQDGRLEESLGNHQGNWSKGLDYFRLDGSTSSENRSIWCSAFNREDNPRARLFLISTRAGGLGINLTAANRVIIFDASWNPSHDVQSIFRIYRFGQKKPCYVYRFIAHGTMEEKVYDRQVAKQSMSNRVVDEQQVHRHFSSNDLNELYSFTPPTNKEDREIPSLPKDVLFAEILKAYSDWIEKYHEHDSLLENVIEEELNEEERKLAWEDYENDKKRGFAPSNTGNAGMSNTMSYQIEYLRQQLKVQYPNKSEQELNQILVYQVSLLMRQQQMKTQMQQQSGINMGMAGNMGMQMGQGSMMAYANQLQQQGLPQAQQQQMYADYQKKLQQANMARLQLQQLQYQQQQQQQSVLRSQLTQPAQRPGLVAPSLPQSRAIEMMLQNYQAPRAQGPQDTSQSKPSS